jgi:Cu/Zn superoxide dismutase
MDSPANRAVNICKLVVVMAATVLWSACAPSVKMTVQVSDATGNSKGQFTVSSTDSGPTNFTKPMATTLSSRPARPLVMACNNSE